MTPELINRINELSRLAKERELTPEEAAERAELRRIYLENFRAAFRHQLNNTVIHCRHCKSLFCKIYQFRYPDIPIHFRKRSAAVR